jgi:hypothetical protein
VLELVFTNASTMTSLLPFISGASGGRANISDGHGSWDGVGLELDDKKYERDKNNVEDDGAQSDGQGLVSTT